MTDRPDKLPRQSYQPGIEAEMHPKPDEVAPCFVFLASSDSSYMTGQVLDPNCGEIING